MLKADWHKAGKLASGDPSWRPPQAGPAYFQETLAFVARSTSHSRSSAFWGREEKPAQTCIDYQG